MLWSTAVMTEPTPDRQPAPQEPEGNSRPAALSSRLLTGRLISLFVHETNNHLATLGESVGLGDDILSARTLSDKDKLRELEKLLSAMGDRLGHAASLVRAFGELGRCLEKPAAAFDVGRAIEDLLPFLSRIARQRNARVRTACDRRLTAAEGDAAALQHLLLALFDNFCLSLEPAATATLRTAEAGPAVVVSLSADCPCDCSQKQFWPWNSLETFAASNGFTLNLQQQGGEITITLRKQV